MKLTNKQLKQIIKEELEAVLEVESGTLNQANVEEFINLVHTGGNIGPLKVLHQLELLLKSPRPVSDRERKNVYSVLTAIKIKGKNDIIQFLPDKAKWTSMNRNQVAEYVYNNKEDLKNAFETGKNPHDRTGHNTKRTISMLVKAVDIEKNLLDNKGLSTQPTHHGG